MTDWLVFAGFTIFGALLAVMAIGIAFSAFMPALDKWNKGYFITFFSLLLLYVVVLFIDMIVYVHPRSLTTQHVITIFEYLFFSVLTLMPLPFLLHCSGENLKNSAWLRAGTAVWGVFCCLLISTQFTDAFHYVTPDHQYVRGAWFPLLIAPLAVIMLLNMACLISRRKMLSKRLFFALLTYLLPTAIMVITYMFAAVDMLVSVWMVFCAMTLFSLILTDSVKEYMRQQQEIARQRASVMVLQMRPHFIYNTLMTIYYLCKQDADKAQQVTLDFTNYLRKNFAAIASERTVPFADEMKHVEAYLAVEQAQHEDNLFVEYDISHTLFRIPPLTLQPIVENAVKYGLDPNGGPLRVFIGTRHTENSSVITVEDTGPGFDPAAVSNPNSALTNIRRRLEMMCGGRLEVTSRSGGGTTVTVTIPDRKTEV